MTIDEKSAIAASAGQIDLQPLVENLELPPSSALAKSAAVGDHGYLLSRAFQPHDAALTISLLPDGPLTSLGIDARQEALGRLLRCAAMIFAGRSRSIPVTWRAFHFGNRLTFQADRLVRSNDGGRTNAGRVVVEIGQDFGKRVFAFLLDRSGARDLSTLSMPEGLLESALAGIPLALSQHEATATEESLKRSVTLDGTLPARIRALSTDDWYKSRLTDRQRQFVDHPLTSSVRLVGAAGTGKTLALVVKCVRELKKARNEGVKARFLFLTHATKSALDIENQVLAMEPELGIEFLGSDVPELVVTTLYALANRQMRYDLDSLTPVSLDGHDGRAFQADLLNVVIQAFRQGDWVVYKRACSEPFSAYMEAEETSMERRFFLWEVLNEFACVLDAEGVRSGTARREQYLTERRKSWMMSLATKEEREVLLALYDSFRAQLREMRAIGGDQMVTDFLNHLDSFRWEATRRDEGFDALFVDELHLFNRQERLVFRHLLRSPEASPTIFMAYDAKQSPRDTFLQLPSLEAKQLDFWRDAKLGKVEKIELVDVFRYTPQIAKVLALVDESFPGQDLDEDWPTYSGISRLEDGPMPIACTLRSTVATYTITFQRAQQLQKDLGKSGRVAVLCASNELFKRYLDFKELRNSFLAVTSREEAAGVADSVRRFVFSMPEFVAGHQFDTVLLIDVNRNEVPEGPYAAAALRKFASQVYLGASRAERVLEVYASEEQGGLSSIITRAVLGGALKSVTEVDLKKA
jgi:hypothetical protein